MHRIAHLCVCYLFLSGSTCKNDLIGKPVNKQWCLVKQSNKSFVIQRYWVTALRLQGVCFSLKWTCSVLEMSIAVCCSCCVICTCPRYLKQLQCVNTWGKQRQLDQKMVRIFGETLNFEFTVVLCLKPTRKSVMLCWFACIRKIRKISMLIKFVRKKSIGPG